MSDEEAIFHRLHPSRALTVGTRVQLHGLTGRPELNGVCGEVIGAPHSKTGRIPIRLTNGESVLLKLQNLLGILAQRTFEALSVDAPDMMTRLEGKYEMFRSICFMLDAVSMYRLRCCSHEMRELAPTNQDYLKFGGYTPRRLVELARRSLTDQPRLAMVQAVFEYLITDDRRRPAQFHAEVRAGSDPIQPLAS